jgi:hypothetical protein
MTSSRLKPIFSVYSKDMSTVFGIHGVKLFSGSDTVIFPAQCHIWQPENAIKHLLENNIHINNTGDQQGTINITT